MRTLIALLLLSGQFAVADTPRTITVSAKSQLKVEPDLVVLDLGVTSREKLLLNAKAYNDKITEEVIGLTPKFGIKKSDVKIVDLNVSPDYGPYQNRSPKPIAYTFSRSIEVRLTDFSKIEPFLEKAFEAGLNDVNQVHFRVSNQRKQQFEARKLAVTFAREKATHLTELTGMKLGKPISIVEGIEYNYDTDGAFGGGGFGTAKNEAGKKDVPKNKRQIPVLNASFQETKSDNLRDVTKFAPGQVEISAEVTIEYEIFTEE